MAELIEQIISDEAFKQVDKMKSELSALQKQFEELIKATESGGGGGGGSPRNKALSEYERLLNQITKSQERLNAMQTTAGVAYTEAQEALRQYNAELKDANRMSKAEEGSIDQMRVKLKQLEQQYSSLSSASRNAIIGKDMLKDLVAVRTELGKLESTMGNFKRNVGNYTNATFQMSQVLRELPAFTFSAQTGMMALSNNLPMLGDAFKSVMASGKTATQTIGIFARSIFSLGNIFTIAMSAFIIFQKEITDFISGTKEADKAVKDLAESIGRDIAQTKLLVGIVENMNISQEKRIDAAKRLIEIYPQTLKNYSAEEIAAGKAAEAIDKITNSIIAYAKIKAIQTDIEGMAAKQYQNQLTMGQDQRKLMNLEKELEIQQRALDLMTPTNRAYDGQVRVVNNLGKEIDRYNQRIKLATEANEEFEQGMKNRSTLAASLFPSVLDERSDKGGKGGKAKAGRSSEIDRIEELRKQFEKEKALLETKLNDELIVEETHDKELIELTKKYTGLRKGLSEKESQSEADFNRDLSKIRVDIFDKNYKKLMETEKEFNEWSKKAMKELTDDYINELERKRKHNEHWAKEELALIKGNIEAMQKMWDDADDEEEERQRKIQENLSLVNDYYRATIDLVQSYSDAINTKEQLAFENKMNNMQEYYSEEEQRINRSFTNQKDKENELLKLNARKKAEEKALNEERKRMLREQAIRQKKVDVMAAITATALAVIKAYTEGDPYTKAARAALAGFVGATQIAKATATPIPEFAKGTESSPEGYAVVGEKGHEMVVEPSGKKWITPARDTITYLKKGSKVITNERLMKMVQDNAYIQLAESGKVTTDTYGKALIDQFEALSNEMKDLKTIMANKEMSAKIYGNFDHYMHVKNNIR